MSATQPRLRACVEAWPDAHEGGYDPRCCRFPKSCSADVYDPAHVTAEDLECPAMTAPEPAPTAEHIDAVAFVIESAWSDGDDATIAHAILTSTDAAVHAALAASLPAEVMLAALGDRGNDEEIRRRLEWATGRNGLRLLAQIRDEGLDVIRVTPEQVAP